MTAKTLTLLLEAAFATCTLSLCEVSGFGRFAIFELHLLPTLILVSLHLQTVLSAMFSNASNWTYEQLPGFGGREQFVLMTFIDDLLSMRLTKLEFMDRLK